MVVVMWAWLTKVGVAWKNFAVELFQKLETMLFVVVRKYIVAQYCTHSFMLVGMLQVDVPVFGYRDTVRVIDDMAQVHSLQDGHGGWNDDMALVRTFRGTSYFGDHIELVDP